MLAVAAGMGTFDHVLPPSVVKMAKADRPDWSAPSGLGPTATHTSVDEHEMDRRTPVPPGTVPICQAVPASSLVRMPPPTAMQRVAVGQMTSVMAIVPRGSASILQVAPPSVLRRISPL
jgi:hypothetical protein